MKVCFRRDALIKLSRFLFYFSQLSAPFLVQFRGFGAQLPPLLFSFSLLKWFPRFRCRHIVISIDNLFPRRWRCRLGSRSVDVWIQIHKKGSSRARYPFSWEHIEKKFKLRDFVFSSLGVLPERMEGDFIRNLVLLWEGCFIFFYLLLVWLTTQPVIERYQRNMGWRPVIETLLGFLQGGSTPAEAGLWRVIGESTLPVMSLSIISRASS